MPHKKEVKMRSYKKAILIYDLLRIYAVYSFIAATPVIKL